MFQNSGNRHQQSNHSRPPATIRDGLSVQVELCCYGVVLIYIFNFFRAGTESHDCDENGPK